MKNAVIPVFLVIALLACRKSETNPSNQPPPAVPPPAQAGAPEGAGTPEGGAAAPVPPSETAPKAPASPRPAPPAESAPEAPEQARRPAPSVCTPAADRLCPADEGGSDPSLRAFRAKLREAVREKSEAKLMPLVAEDIRISFGDDNGIEAFRKRWRPSSPDSALWRELEEVLSLGGSFRDEDRRTTFWAPYVYSRWPSRLDPFLSMAVIRAGVPLRERPAESARTVATLDWAIVERVLESARKDAAWIQVRAPGGQRGWVRASDVRSSVDWRAGLRRQADGWKLAVLVSGD